MKTEDIARSVAEAMDGIIVIVHMTEQKGWEVIIPIQEEVPAAPAERFGSSISLLSLSAMVSMNYLDQSC